MKIGDWVKITDGYWKGKEGEVFICNRLCVWVRLYGDGDEVICFPHQVEKLPILGQTFLIKGG